jgi:hypothetical protein
LLRYVTHIPGRKAVTSIHLDGDAEDRADDQNPALLALAQGKLAGLVGKPSGYINSLPTSVRRRIDGLKGIQAEHSKVESEFQLAILELEKKVCHNTFLVYRADN